MESQILEYRLGNCITKITNTREVLIEIVNAIEFCKSDKKTAILCKYRIINSNWIEFNNIWYDLKIDLSLFQILILKISRKQFVIKQIEQISFNLEKDLYKTRAIKQAKVNLKSYQNELHRILGK